MLTDAVKNALDQLAEPLVRSTGLDLWGIEYGGSPGRPVIRVYIDSPGGITVDDCATVSRSLSVALDVEDAVPGAYVLEVSSPGLDRPFFHPGQMAAYLGCEVEATLRLARDGRRRFAGPLAAVEERGVTIQTEDGPVTLDWDDVKKARLRHAHPGPNKAEDRRPK